MTIRPALRRAFTPGSEAPARMTVHEIMGRTSQKREIAPGGAFALYGEPAPARDPDAEAGRGRLGHAY